MEEILRQLLKEEFGNYKDFHLSLIKRSPHLKEDTNNHWFFDTTNVCYVPIKYSIRMADFIKNLKKHHTLVGSFIGLEFRWQSFFATHKVISRLKMCEKLKLRLETLEK